MGNTKSKRKEGLYTDVQIVSPQNGFNMYYAPADYGYFDTSNRIKCCQLDHPRHRPWLNEGFTTSFNEGFTTSFNEGFRSSLNLQKRKWIPDPEQWIYIGYVEKPFRISHDVFPLQARVIVPGRLYEYRVYGPYGEYHGVKQTRKISNGDPIEVWTLSGTVSTWRAKLQSNKWTDLF